MKLLLIEAHSKRSILPALNSALAELHNYKSISIVTTVQFCNQLSAIKRFLSSKGKRVIIAKPQRHAVYAGQVLGCDTTAASDAADCVLYIGTGDFHPMGIRASKPAFKLNPFTKHLEQLDASKRVKQSAARLYKLRQAKCVGILVSSKSGQRELQAKAKSIKTLLEEQGKQVYIFIADTFSPAELMNYPQIEVWVNTACPRIVDDRVLFNRPIVNAVEILHAL